MNCVKKQLSLLGVVATVVLVFAGVAEAHGPTLTVDVDEASFLGPAPTEVGPFTVEGNTGSGAGTFQCWGWINDDEFETANVSQSFNVEDRGLIMTQGPEGGLLAIVGGTGDFKNARGEARQVFNDDGTFDFTMTFKFDVKHRKR